MTMKSLKKQPKTNQKNNLVRYYKTASRTRGCFCILKVTQEVTRVGMSAVAPIPTRGGQRMTPIATWTVQ